MVIVNKGTGHVFSVNVFNLLGSSTHIFLGFHAHVVDYEKGKRQYGYKP